MKQNTKVKKNGICYVVPKLTTTYHPIARFQHDLIYYPEKYMSLIQTVTYQRYVKSIITENPYIIASYPVENVRVWTEKEGWIEPKRQTFGMPVEEVLSSILGINQVIPSSVLDGGVAMKIVANNLEQVYIKAQKLEFTLVS